jgi:hypothetical protein
VGRFVVSETLSCTLTMAPLLLAVCCCGDGRDCCFGTFVSIDSERESTLSCTLMMEPFLLFCGDSGVGKYVGIEVWSREIELTSSWTFTIAPRGGTTLFCIAPRGGTTLSCSLSCDTFTILPVLVFLGTRARAPLFVGKAGALPLGTSAFTLLRLGTRDKALPLGTGPLALLFLGTRAKAFPMGTSALEELFLGTSALEELFTGTSAIAPLFLGTRAKALFLGTRANASCGKPVLLVTAFC